MACFTSYAGIIQIRYKGLYDRHTLSAGSPAPLDIYALFLAVIIDEPRITVQQVSRK